MTGDTVGVVEKTINSVCNGAHTNWYRESEDVNSGRTYQVVLCVDKIISRISDQVGLESQTEWDIQGKVGTCS